MGNGDSDEKMGNGDNNSDERMGNGDNNSDERMGNGDNNSDERMGNGDNNSDERMGNGDSGDSDDIKKSGGCPCQILLPFQPLLTSPPLCMYCTSPFPSPPFPSHLHIPSAPTFTHPIPSHPCCALPCPAPPRVLSHNVPWQLCRLAAGESFSTWLATGRRRSYILLLVYLLNVNPHQYV
ncbi:hypothetical protein Pmani_001474 [Petrolisthes manimaculis]|uniref:Uncharacterized protein n=1 Tax=Petrolisthes manimaculis TaxID=1843537 RepID=A0AAE1QMM5_9EUCA|nr:hypothetical protein Pmani_001474 [Petrolisthes manimaculis]